MPVGFPHQTVNQVLFGILVFAAISALQMSMAWIVTTLIITRSPGTLTWFDLPGGSANTNPAEALELFLHPDFFDNGARLLEALSMSAISMLLALAAWRSRLNFRRFAEAEEVARELLSHDGVPVPERREATVLFSDIKGFTSLSENAGPDHVLDMLNEWFHRAGDAVSRHGGIVTQFQGDGLLATFSAQVAGENPAAAAVAAAQEMLTAAAGSVFDGETIRIRVGIATGPVVAGALGGPASGTDGCRLVTRAAVRGRSGELDVYEPAG